MINLTKVACLSAALSLCTPAAATDALPDLGEVSQSEFSPHAERVLGEAIMRDIRNDSDYLDDAELIEYLNTLGHRLASNSPDNRQSFEFFLITDSTLNAFALPGGYIGVHTGLILATQSESELAAVLAHEISHVTQHHLARMIAHEQQNSITSLAGLAIAILAARSNPQLSSAALATVQAGSIQSSLDFTRDNEREADRIGVQILQSAGFDPHAMPAFFERLQKTTRLYENNAPAYLRTHPITSERIADIQNRVAGLPYRQIPDSLEFQLVRAKLRADSGPPQDAILYFESNLKEKKYNSETAQHYGLALASMRAKDFTRAEKELATLRKSTAPNAMTEMLAARLKTAMGQPDLALAQYRRAFASFPLHRALAYGYAEALLRNRQNTDALKLVSEQLQLHPGDYRLHELQAQSYAALGKNMQQHRAQAEAYALKGNLTAAIEQLQIALKSGDGDFYQLSIAESRLRELRALDAESRKP